jgi:hypothetical protein
MPGSAIYRRVFVALCLLFLMPPLAWIADKAFVMEIQNP